MIPRAALLWLALAPAVPAQDLPALFDVAGVAAGDVLNIRAEPSARAAVLGSFLPDARGVEVVEWSADAGWALVPTGEGAGWVARRFLAPSAAPAWNAPGRPLSCVGTEPFWSARLNEPPGTLLVSTPDTLPQAAAITGTAPVAGQPGLLGMTFSSSAGAGFAVVRAGLCSDGMSDRPWGLSVTLFPPGPSGTAGWAGCCALVP